MIIIHSIRYHLIYVYFQVPEGVPENPSVQAFTRVRLMRALNDNTRRRTSPEIEKNCAQLLDTSTLSKKTPRDTIGYDFICTAYMSNSAKCAGSGELSNCQTR